MFDNQHDDQSQQNAQRFLLASTSDLQQLSVEQLSGDQNDKSESNATPKQPKASFVLSVGILIKSTIGAGILSLPYVIQKMGIFLTIVFYILAGLLSNYSSVTYLSSKNMSGRSNIATIMHSIHPNPVSKAVVSGIVVLGTLGACIAQTLLLKQTVRKLLSDLIDDKSLLDSFFTGQQFIVLVASVLWLPLIFTSKIQQLRIYSMVGVIGVFLFLVAFIIYFVNTTHQSFHSLSPLSLFPSNWLSAFSTVPNIVFSLAFYMNFFPIYKGLVDANDNKMNKLVFTGVLCCSVMYIAIGVMGRLIVGPSIAPNLLNSISYNDMSPYLYMLIYLGFIIELFFAYPVVFFSCKNNFICILKIIATAIEQKSSYKSLGNQQEYNKKQESRYGDSKSERRQKMFFIFGVLFIFTVILTAALLFNNVQVVFNFIGAVTSSTLNVLLPNYYNVRLININNFRKGWKYYLSLAILVVMVPFCIFQIISLYVK